MAGFLDEIEPLKQTALAELKAAPDLAALEQTKGAWIGPNGKFTALMKQLGRMGMIRENRSSFKIQWFEIFLCLCVVAHLLAEPASAQNRDLLVANNTTTFNASILRYSSAGNLLGNFAVPGFTSNPTGMAFDSSGKLYVAIHGGTSAIYRYSSSGANLGVFATAALSTPLGLAFDSSGKLIVCNYGDGSLNAYSPSGTLLWRVLTGVINPHAIALDGNDNIYISNSNQGPGFGVFRFSPSGGQKTLFATGADFDARGLAFDRVGNLYVANPYDNTVRRFAPNGIPLGSFANTGLNLPFALAFDESGELFVSNQLGGAIRRFSPQGEDLGNFAVVNTVPANPVGLVFFPVPEPGPIPLLALGMLSGLLSRKRARNSPLRRRPLNSQ